MPKVIGALLLPMAQTATCVMGAERSSTCNFKDKNKEQQVDCFTTMAMHASSIVCTLQIYQLSPWSCLPPYHPFFLSVLNGLRMGVWAPES